MIKISRKNESHFLPPYYTILQMGSHRSVVKQFNNGKTSIHLMDNSHLMLLDERGYIL